MGDLSNLKISNTYSRLLQADPDTNQLQDGVGSNPSTIIFNGTTLKYVDGNQQNNYILTSDANGVARWAANSGGGGGSTDVYWSANTDGTISTSGDTTDIRISGDVHTKGSITLDVPTKGINLSYQGIITAKNDGGVARTIVYNIGDTGVIFGAAETVTTKLQGVNTELESTGYALIDSPDIRLGSSTSQNVSISGNTVMNGTLSASSVNVGNGDGSVSAATITASGEIDGGSLDIEGDADINGTTNLDNTDIDGTLVVDGTNISLDSTSTLNIDNSNTSNGITIGTATSGVPIQLGHSTSNVRINDNLIVTGNTVMNGTLSATTSCKVGNGNGTISAATINGVTINGTTVEGTIDGGTF